MKYALCKEWWQKVPSKCQSDGKKRHQNSEVMAENATKKFRRKIINFQMRKSGGKKRRQNSKVMAKNAIKV